MIIALAAVLQLAMQPAPAQAVYHGRDGNLDVAVPRLQSDIVVDGSLDEAPWREAALLTGFSQYNPVDGLAAEDSTEVFVWYTEHEIYFGVRAYEPHGSVRASLADRDRLDSDDYISLMIDTFDQRRQAIWFLLNPLGVQGDGVYTETGRGSSEDLSPDYVFESKGRVTDYGYELEVRIPFKSLNYPSRKVQDWGLQVIRRVQHSGQDQSWTPLRRGQTSFLGQAGRLKDLSNLRRGLVMDINPVTTARYDGARIGAGEDGRFRYGNPEPEFGLNLRWGITTDLTMNATVNPDFSQVETDAGQINFDPRQSLYFAEKRPFFLDNIQQFTVPNRLIYTRRIADPIGAAKFTGSIGGATIGFMSAVDAEELSRSGDDTPVFNILRVRRNVGEQSSIGVLYTDRIDGDDYNRVAGIDGRLVLASQYTLAFQAAGSFWRTGDTQRRKPLWNLSFDRSGRRFNLLASVNAIHDDFVAGAGFVNRRGIINTNIRPRFTFYGDADSRVQAYTFGLTFDNTWDYQEFEDGAGPDDIKFHINNEWRLRGGWNLGADAYIETFRYPAAYYANYRVVTTNLEGAVDTVQFEGRRRIPNYDIMLRANTPQWSRFSGNVFFVVGRDENFEEWAPGYIVIADVGATWRPDDKARITFDYIEQRTIRPEVTLRDGTTKDPSVVRLSRIPRLKLEYQISRPFFIRLVGQYVADQRDALADYERNGGDPILIYNPADGSYWNGAFESGDFRGDILLSYQPSPGTVIFAGYGSSATDQGAFAFKRIQRNADGFFVKLSYLFRL